MNFYKISFKTKKKNESNLGVFSNKNDKEYNSNKHFDNEQHEIATWKINLHDTHFLECLT